MTPLDTPYIGLTPYLEEHWPYYFGREKFAEVVIDNLLATRLTLLYGASGVGKSSLLNAGVGRRLRRQAEENMKRRGTPGLAMIIFRDWRDAPMAALTRQVCAAVSPELTESRLAPALRELGRRVEGDVLVILDQFEEYFQYHPREEGTFAAEFPEAVSSRDVQANFLISIREDALARLDRFEGSIPDLFRNYLRVEHLDRAAARQAIQCPLEEYNRRHGTSWTIEPKLVEAVLDQLRAGRVVVGDAGIGRAADREDSDDAEERIETPFLQLVMSRLWTEEQQAGSTAIRLATLEGLGGAERMVRMHLDDAMATLTDEERSAAAAIFHYLVTPSRTKIAHTARDLAGYADVAEAQLGPLLEKLHGQRILRAVAPPFDQPGASCYEIFHDVLARGVLEWRTRYVQDQKAKDAEERAERLRKEAEELAAARNRAEDQARLSRARELAAAAVSNLSVDPELSILLAQQAVATTFDVNGAITPESRDALQRAVEASRVRVTFSGHTGAIYAQAFHPDGRRVITGGEDACLRVWDADTGAELAAYRQLAQVVRLALSRDGERVAMAYIGSPAAIWNLASGTELVRLSGDAGNANSVAFSPDGKLLATGGWDSVVRVVDAQTGEEVVSLRGHAQSINEIVFSPDGKLLASTSGDRSTVLWDIARGRMAKRLAGHLRDTNSGDFSPDGKLLATAGMDFTVKLWDVETGLELRALAGHSNTVFSTAFEASGARLATGSADGVAKIWEVPSGRELVALRGHTNPLSTVRFSPDSTRIATSSWDGTARVWHASSHADSVMDVQFSPDSRLLASASRDKTAKLWEVSSERELLTLRGHSQTVSRIRFDSKGERAITSSEDGTARVWDVRTGRELAVIAEHKDMVLSACFSPDGSLCATAGADRILVVWSFDTGQRLTTFSGFPNTVEDVCFSPDGKRLITADSGGVVRLLDIALGKQVMDLWPSRHVFTVVFSPDGSRFAAACLDRKARIWNTETGEELLSVEHGNAVQGVVFSQDGKRIATASWDWTAKVWDAETGREILGITHSGEVFGAALSPDGRYLATAGVERSPRVHLLDIKELRALAEKRVTRKLTDEERGRYLHEGE